MNEKEKFRIFQYSFDIPYGNGQGIVCAKNEEDALKLVKEEGYYIEYCLKYENGVIKLEEIFLENNCLIIFSYAE